MNKYSNIKGFNYIPSYAYILNDVIDNFNSSVIEKEFKLASSVGANSLRVFVSMASFQKDNVNFLEKFSTILNIAEKNNLSIMPVLFNRWTDYNYPVGQLDLSNVLYSQLSPEFKRYISEFICKFKYDTRIIMWDMCNEPFFPVVTDGSQMWEDIKEREAKFWSECIKVARSENPTQPITIGFGGYACDTPEIMYSLVDIICFHPYSDWNGSGYMKFIKDFEAVATKYNKPLLCSETCQGSLDDETRGECIDKSLSALKEEHLGWYIWMLCSGNAVSGRRDRTDINANAGDRGYFPFFLEDGTLRNHHNIIYKFTEKVI